MNNEVAMYVRVYQDSAHNCVLAAKSISRSKDTVEINLSDGSFASYMTGDFYVMSLCGKTIAEYRLRDK